MPDTAVFSDISIMQMEVGGLSGPTLIPVSLDAREAISMPYEIRVEFVSDVPRLAADSFLYRPVLVTLQRNAPTPRYFHGAARRFTTLGPDERENWHYAVEIVPQIWFMSQAENCRFFENRTVQQIVSTLLGDIGVLFSFRLHETPPVREYTVQYNETDLAFISRLMEESGYFYFFQHSSDGHELVIAESNIAFQAIPDSKLTFHRGVKEYDNLAALHAWTATAIGKVTLDDYDPTGVNKPLPGTESTILTASGTAARAVYHWPALAMDTGEVAARARRRIEAAEAFASLSEGESWNEGFVPGGTFTLAEDPLTGQQHISFVIRSVEHRATSPYHLAAGRPQGDDIQSTYENRFSAFPSATPWRQPLAVPRPRMAGIYSAVVIGPPGEEIYHDKLARVKVQFPWSHLGDTTPGGAIWVRVIKSWAGGGWGTQFIPRIGTEVAVSFMDGDPDRPVVVGALYNAANDPLYDPAEKNKTGWRTRSTPGGSASNYSEMTIDDTIGAERIFFHAERDHVGEVEHDQNLTVDNCRLVKVGVDEQRTIGQNQTTKIGNNETFMVGNTTNRTIGKDYLVKVGSNRTATIGTDDLLEVGANRTTTIGTDHLLKVGANQTTTIGTNNVLKIGAGQSVTVGASNSMTVGSNQILKVGAAQSVTVGAAQSITVGAAQTVKVASGHSTTVTSGDIVLTADTGNIALMAPAASIGLTASEVISLSCGPSSIAITPMGVQIEALTISFDGVLVSFLSVLWSVLGVMAMIEGALVTINMGLIPGGGGGEAAGAADAGEAAADEALAVANAAGRAGATTASDMKAAVIKAASAAMRSQFGRGADAIEAAGAAFAKVSAAIQKVKSGLAAAHDAEMAARASAVPYVEKAATALEAGYYVGVIPTRYEDKTDGEDSLAQTEAAQTNASTTSAGGDGNGSGNGGSDDSDEDPDATVNLSARNAPQPAKPSTPS